MSAATLPVLAVAALLTAGAVVGTEVQGTTVSSDSGAAHDHHPGMMQMHDQMMTDHPGMMEMHDQMMTDHPGTMRMHERMAGDAPCRDHG